MEPRTSVLRRSADDTDPTERIVVANADLLVVVIALADPDPQPRLLDRALVAAYDGGLSPVLCLTKSDLADPAPVRDAYAALDLPIVVVRPDGSGDDAVRALLHGRTSALLRLLGGGQVHAGQPAGARRLPGDRRGEQRHRPGPAHLLQRGRAAAARRRVDHRHPRASARSAWPTWTRPGCSPPSRTSPPARTDCPPGCSHLEGTPGCALDAWAVTAEPAAVERLASLRRVLASRDGDAPGGGDTVER